MAGEGGILNMLNQEQIKAIHQTTLELLENTGVVIQEETALSLLHEVGAKVDFGGQRARFPACLMEKLICQVPDHVTWYARDPKKTVQLEGTKVCFGPAAGAVNVLDSNGKRRPATIQDAYDFCRLVDALDFVEEGHCVVYPTDAIPGSAHAHMLAAMAKFSSKPFRGRPRGREEATDSIRMAELLVGGRDALKQRPIIFANINPVSPLQHAREMVEGTLEFARRGLPVCFSPQVQAGTTGPVTLAGTLAQHNAEVLSGLAIAQAANPGVPVIYGCVTSVSDMRTGGFAYGAVEGAMLNVASVQLARYYHLPSRATSGFTESKMLDYQCALESMMTNVMVCMAGPNYIQGAAGGLESSLTASYEKMVIDDEALGMIARAMRGISVNEDSLASDLIAKVGPGGHYLAEGHTRTHFRREIFIPKLIDRLSYEAWKAAGAKDMVERAREKARSILAHHQPQMIEPALALEIDQLVAEVEARHR